MVYADPPTIRENMMQRIVNNCKNILRQLYFCQLFKISNRESSSVLTIMMVFSNILWGRTKINPLLAGFLMVLPSSAGHFRFLPWATGFLTVLPSLDSSWSCLHWLDSSRSCLHWPNQNGTLKFILLHPRRGPWTSCLSFWWLNAGNGLNSCGHWYWIT